MVRGFGVLSISAVLLAGGVLTGCGDTSTNDDGDASPGSASPTVSASASASADGYVEASAEGPAQNVPKPSKPAVADEESVEGAQAFLDYLSDARAYAQQTGDTSLAREVTAEECYSCLESYDSIDEIYEAGGWASRGREAVTVTSTDLPIDEYGFYAPTVEVEYEGITVWNRDGHVEREIPPEEFSDDSLVMHMSYINGEWTYITGAPE